MATPQLKITSILTLIFCFVLNSTYGQSKEINITFIGNAGLYMSDGDLNIYVDFPYKSGAYGYMKYNDSNLDSIKNNSFFLFTHGHLDHYSKKLFKETKQKLYGPFTMRSLLSKKRKFRLEHLNDTLEYFSIKKFKTKHRLTFQHYSYLITWHNKRIFISGDAESADTISKIDNMDLAFIPYWILYDAAEKNLEIDSRKIALYHLYPEQKVENNKKNKIIVPKQNQMITVE